MSRYDVAVVGAGPAGIAAALAAASCGGSVLLVDEGRSAGGHLRWSIARHSGRIGGLHDARGFEIADWSASELAAAGVHFVSDAMAWGLFDGPTLGVTAAGSSHQYQAGAVIVATGSTDIVATFPGWDLPGVMTARAALRLMHLDLVLPGQHVAVAGSGTYADEVVEALSVAGLTPAAIVRDCSALVAGGDEQVGWIEYAGTRATVDCVVLALGKQPDPELAFQAGAESEFSVRDRCHVARRSRTMETSLGGIYVVGDCAGICSTSVAFTEGRVAALAAMGSTDVDRALAVLDAARREAEADGTGSESIMTDTAQQRSGPNVETSYESTRIGDETIVCRCEEIAAGSIRQALAEGYSTLNDVKRRSRAGMGACQGIYCLRTISAMLEGEAGVAVATLAPMTPRPPARMIPLHALATIEEG